MNETYLTTDEVAKRLRLSARYLEGLRVSGGGPAFLSFGRAVRYRLEDLEVWAASKVRRSTSQALEAA